MYLSMNKFFVLTVALGSIVHLGESSKEIKGIPDNALELLSKGCNWMELKPEAVDYLKKQPKEKLQAILAVRKKQGYTSDVLIIEEALASYDDKPEATPPEPAKEVIAAKDLKSEKPNGK